MNFAFAPGIVAALFAAVAAIVTALYLLRPPPRRITIASTLIWDRVLKHKRRDSERWRWWLSLALSLVIALALAAALSRPDAIGIGGAPQRLILVVDNAPTMAALRTDGRTRLDHARDEARRLVQTADTGTAFLVVDTMRSIGSPAFESADAALARIDALQVAVGGFASYPDLPVTDRSAGTIDAVLITDGVTPLDAPDDVRQVSVFEPVSNVGITGFDVRANVADPRRVEAFVELANADGQPTTVGLTLTGAGRPPIRQQVEVPARGFANLTVPVSSFTGGALQASIDAAGDGLALDDIAYAVLPGGRTLKVALATAGDRALERALRLDPRVELTVLSPVRYAPQSGIDVYVFDRFVPPVPPIAPMLLLRPEAATWLPPADTAGGASRIADWRQDHPVLQNLSLADVDVRRRIVWRIGDTGVPLARTEAGTALIVADDTMPRRLRTGFAVADTNFADRASFPMFVTNALTWLAGELPAVLRPLGTVSVPLERARVVALDGTPQPTRSIPGATLITSDAPAFYTADNATARVRVVTHVLDPAVTDVNASTLSAVATGQSAAPTTSYWRRPAVWMLLLGAGLLLMAVEWWTYHRRLTL